MSTGDKASPGMVVLHGHFYQPPRENPWTGQVDAEPNAAPDHDWNVRITRECYRPLTPLYEYLSFDFGPTLLDWLEREARDVHDAVIRGDRASVKRLGHGNALAMPYHHIILPLSSRRDKQTEIRWGIADFRRRFGREPEGFWLPETAVDQETLEVVAGEGIAFTLLAPHQVVRAPARGLPVRIHLGDRKSIVAFVYDGGLSHEIAFGGFSKSPDRWTAALQDTPPGTITAFAVDGETFGHHHKGGDRTLATVVQRVSSSNNVRLGNFSAALSAYPPAQTTELVAPSSWSCSHGIERWRSACGCRMHHDVPTQQDWRAPLRAAVDWLATEVHGIYEREGSNLPGGAWAFRDAAGGTPEAASNHSDAARLIEMERGVLRAMTSCGWFFDDVAGIEGRQILRYAAHAISLAGPEASRLKAGFIEKLGHARSNDPKAGRAAEILRQALEPAQS